MFYLLERIKTAYYSGEFPFAKMYRRGKFGTLSFREKGSLDLNIYNGPPFQNHKNLIPETKTFLAYYKASTLNKYYKWLKSCEILWKHEIAPISTVLKGSLIFSKSYLKLRITGVGYNTLHKITVGSYKQPFGGKKFKKRGFITDHFFYLIF